MHVHILGICGTFMGGVAALAKAAGHRVSGCDSNVYPPMSTQLESLGIELIEGWDESQLSIGADVYIVGNVVSRGNPLMEAILDRGLDYISGPAWLSAHVLRGRKVIAVAGTHGKTTTTSLLAHLLERDGLAPGFLIGGVPDNFGISARLGDGEWFVIEADEYDTAFFDKRAKFVHYRPTIAVLNNLEFDHADIYDDLAAIRWQFHQLMRIVPRQGQVIVNADDQNLPEVLAEGCWSSIAHFSTEHVACDVSVLPADDDRNVRVVSTNCDAVVSWSQQGPHNRANTAAALLAASKAGVPVARSAPNLASFAGVARRMQRIAVGGGIEVYDDFAHHPTAIRQTIEGMRDRAPDARLVVALELRSNTMKQGVHAGVLADALDGADRIIVQAELATDWDVAAAFSALGDRVSVHRDAQSVFTTITSDLVSGDRLVLMSNGAFGGMSRLVADWMSKTNG
ncbi:MAG: UDP-N-acetylmuramate:L-alanyl-gamma-D-glutamyl-meso-diaminopimelate ligase [Pseudomonadota bacterium]